MLRRVALVLAVAVAGIALAAPASAHIDPDPKGARPDSRLTVGFTVEHGCDDSPTIQLDMRLPDGVTDVVPEPLDDWTGSVDDDVVTYVGGPLPADVAGTFRITMSLPSTPDTTIYFPFVQRCVDGEIRWIGIPAEPGDELDEPAPAMILFGPAVTSTPAPTPAPTTETTPESEGGDTAATTPGDGAPGPTSSAAGTVPASASTVADSSTGESDGSGSNTGTIMFIVSIAAVALVAGLAAVRSRSGRAPDPTA